MAEDDKEDEETLEEVESTKSTSTTGFSFKEYPSIQQHHNTKVIRKLLENPALAGVEWVALEKVHGANFSIVTDGTTVKFARRNGFLEITSKFNGFQKLVPSLSEKVLKLYKDITSAEAVTEAKDEVLQKLSKIAADESADSSKTMIINVYGELFGGSYNHPDVAPVYDVPRVQKGVEYTPDVHFIAFDLLVGKTWIPYEDACKVFKHLELLYVDPIATGSLKELLDFNVESFETRIPEMFGLPKIKGNTAEGIVIRPLRFEDHVLIKKKSELFLEKFKAPKSADDVDFESLEVKTEGKVFSFAEIKLEFAKYFNENRLKSVISKEEDISSMKEMMALVPKVRQDAFEDFQKDFASSLADGRAPMILKYISKEGSRLAAELIKAHGPSLLKV